MPAPPNPLLDAAKAQKLASIPTDYVKPLPDYRLDEIREKASSYAVNEAPAIPVQVGDVIALIDELRRERAKVVRPPPLQLASEPTPATAPALIQAPARRATANTWVTALLLVSVLTSLWLALHR